MLARCLSWIIGISIVYSHLLLANTNELRTCLHTLSETQKDARLQSLSERSGFDGLLQSPAIVWGTQESAESHYPGFSVYDGQRLLFCPKSNNKLTIVNSRDPRFTSANQRAYTLAYDQGSRSNGFMSSVDRTGNAIESWDERGYEIYDIGTRCRDSLNGEHLDQVKIAMTRQLRNFFKETIDNYQSYSDAGTDTRVDRNRTTGAAETVVFENNPGAPNLGHQVPHPERIQAVVDHCKSIPEFAQVINEHSEGFVALKSSYCRTSSGQSDILCKEQQGGLQFWARRTQDALDRAQRSGSQWWRRTQERGRSFYDSASEKGGELMDSARRNTDHTLGRTQEIIGDWRQRLSN